MNHLFGPVNSRRLGLSLGIDLVPAKTCSLNCVYCECGNTSTLTTERKEYVSGDAIVSELADFLATSPHLDYITFAGSGEPTLNTALSRVLGFLKESFPGYRTALLTNGTLLTDPVVRREILPFDLVLPSLDAVSRNVFAKINRPSTLLDNDRIIEGLIAFREEYRGTIWLELFIIPGVNDTAGEIARFKEVCLRIRPERVQLNTLDRPGPCSWVTPAPFDNLTAIASALSPLPVELVTRQARHPGSWQATGVSTVTALIARRPSTIEEIAAATGMTINEVQVLLTSLESAKTVAAATVGDRTFYRLV